MYVVPPPQRSDPASGSDDLLVYQAWKGSNVCHVTLFLLLFFLIFFCIFLYQESFFLLLFYILIYVGKWVYLNLMKYSMGFVLEF